MELRAKLAEVLDPRVDSVRLYGLCGGCAGKVETWVVRRRRNRWYFWREGDASGAAGGESWGVARMVGDGLGMGCVEGGAGKVGRGVVE